MKNETHVFEFPTEWLARVDTVAVTNVTDKDFSLGIRVLSNRFYSMSFILFDNDVYVPISDRGT